MSKKIPKITINLIDKDHQTLHRSLPPMLDPKKDPDFAKPNYEPQKISDYVDLFTEKAWKIWAVVIGGLLLLLMGIMK